MDWTKSKQIQLLLILKSEKHKYIIMKQDIRLAPVPSWAAFDR